MDKNTKSSAPANVNLHELIKSDPQELDKILSELTEEELDSLDLTLDHLIDKSEKELLSLQTKYAAMELFNMGYKYYHGTDGIEQIYETAFQYFSESAALGNDLAESYMGHCYFDGQGVEQDYTKAAEWYAKAAAQGNATAQNNLGYQYENGLGVEQDYTKAVEWYKKAVERESPTAHYHLGFCFENGLGVEENLETALEFYKKAAEKDVKKAKEAFERLQNEINNEDPSQTLAYEVNDDGKTCTVTGMGDCKETNLVIPDTIDKYPVTGIAKRAFANYYRLSGVISKEDEKSLESVVIPDTVTDIGEEAFAGNGKVSVSENNPNYLSDNGNLYTKDKKTLLHYAANHEEKTFIIPDTVTHIGAGAFLSCGHLTDVTVPESVTSIGDRAFDGCVSLTDVRIPDTVTDIGDRTFARCTMLTRAVLGKSVTIIGNDAFYKCTGLTRISIGNAVTEIGNWAFCKCKSLTNMILPDSVSYIGAGAFSHCKNLIRLQYNGTQEQWKNVKLSPVWTFRSCIQEIQYKAPVPTQAIPVRATEENAISVEKTARNPKNMSVQEMCSLAHRYYTGNGMPQNYAKAAEWYAKSAEQGYDAAQNNLGYCYQYGHGVEQDFVKAAEWYMKAAKQGNASAQNSLGDCYNYGEGVAKDSFKAVDWYTKAAKNGNAIAQFNLARCYENGRGVAKNYARAIEWYAKAAQQGDEEAGEAVERLKKISEATKTQDAPTLQKQPNCESHGLNYEVNENQDTCTITGIGTCTDTELMIPETIDGHRVTGIADNAFKSSKTLTGVEIPDSVTAIGNSAFHGCKSLAQVTFGKSVKMIGEAAFRYCLNLLYIDLPASVESIGKCALAGVGEVNAEKGNPIYFTVDGNLYSDEGKTLVHYALNRKEETFTVPSSVRMIDSFAFRWCKNLKSIVIGNGVESIGESAFSDCEALEELILPDSVKSIGKNAFLWCKSMKRADLGNGVTEIGESAFDTCTSLISVTCGSALGSIGKGAFRDCESLKEIILSDSITAIGEHAFCRCKRLIDVSYTGTREQWEGIALANTWNKESSIREIRYGAQMPVRKRMAQQESPMVQLKIPTPQKEDPPVQKEDKVFSQGLAYRVNGGGKTCTITGVGTCKDTSIAIPEAIDGYSVTDIADEAFRSCTVLTNLIISDSVKNVGLGAFRDCQKLTAVTIGNSVRFIGDLAFSGCVRLVSVTLTASVANIGLGAFANVGEIIVSEKNRKYRSIDGNLYTADEKTLLQYATASTKTHFTVPDSVTVIAKRAFFGCKMLESVTVGDSVTTIGETAFRLCGNLKKISIGNAVTSIDKEAFVGCEKLTDVTFGRSVESISTDAFALCVNLETVVLPESLALIGERAFLRCGKLARVTIPHSVKSIGKSAFGRCVALKDVRFTGNLSQWKKIVFAEDWKNGASIREINFLADSKGLDISRGLEYRANEDGQTCEITGIGACMDRRIVIPEMIDGYSVTAIGESAFTESANLTGIVILSSVTKIGANAFGGCVTLSEMDIAASVTAIDDGAFNNCENLSFIRYAGNKNQWKEIALGKKWKAKAPIRRIECTDKAVKFLF